MRTLDSMPKHKQLKIASETLYLYAPLAHRLGLYAIKTELEDLGLKFTKSEVYKAISEKLAETKRGRLRYINKFIIPIREEMEGQGFNTQLKEDLNPFSQSETKCLSKVSNLKRYMTNLLLELLLIQNGY